MIKRLGIFIDFTLHIEHYSFDIGDKTLQLIDQSFNLITPYQFYFIVLQFLF